MDAENSSSYVPINQFEEEENKSSSSLEMIGQRDRNSNNFSSADNGNPRGTGMSKKGFISFMIIYSILLLGLIGFGTAIYFQMKSHEDELTSKFLQLAGKYEELELEFKSNEIEKLHRDEEVNQRINNTFATITALNTTANTKFGSITTKIIKLSNHSNLEVIEKLEETKDEINKNLGNVTDHVHGQLNALTLNVSRQMEKSANTLKLTQDNVKFQLNTTLIKMRDVANTASQKIELVQNDVTSQLSLMDSTLKKTKDDLHSAVLSAQEEIQNEVKLVKDNIEQYVIITNKQFAAENDFVKYQLAGTFTLLGCLISLWHLTSHMRHYEKPDIQRRIMAVLWMVPIYSITSWLSLVFPQAEYVLSAFRDGYEAYVVYTFIALLIAILQDGESHDAFIEKLTQQVIEENQQYNDAVRNKLPRPDKHLTPPCPCCYTQLRVTSVAVAFLNQCKLMGMQFVIMKPTLAVLPYFIRLAGYDYDSSQNAPFHDKHVNWNSAKLYIIILQNVSVAVAFYGLLKFYHGTEKELQWCDPWPKFLCVKGVVFMTFWQGIAIQFMSNMGFLDDKAANQIQNLLICIEMLLASIAHFYIFPYHEWRPGYKKEKKKIVLNDTLAVRDFISDFKKVVSRWENTSSVVAPSHTTTSAEEIVERSNYTISSENNNSTDVLQINTSSAAHVTTPIEFVEDIETRLLHASQSNDNNKDGDNNYSGDYDYDDAGSNDAFFNDNYTNNNSSSSSSSRRNSRSGVGSNNTSVWKDFVSHDNGINNSFNNNFSNHNSSSSSYQNNNNNNNYNSASSSSVSVSSPLIPREAHGISITNITTPNNSSSMNINRNSGSGGVNTNNSHSITTVRGGTEFEESKVQYNSTDPTHSNISKYSAGIKNLNINGVELLKLPSDQYYQYDSKSPVGNNLHLLSPSPPISSSSSSNTTLPLSSSTPISSASQYLNPSQSQSASTIISPVYVNNESMDRGIIVNTSPTIQHQQPQQSFRQPFDSSLSHNNHINNMDEDPEMESL